MFSFAIITAGERRNKLADLLASIAAQGVECDVTIAVDANKRGYLGALRNQAVRAGRGDIVVVLDDDITLAPDFCKAVADFPGTWDVMCPRVLNPDGSRYWDWREWNGGQQRMVDYSVPDTGDITPPGCAVILNGNQARFGYLGWDDTIPFYTPPFEDVVFAKELHLSGYTCTMNPAAVAHHNDDRYYQSGDVVMKK